MEKKAVVSIATIVLSLSLSGCGGGAPSCDSGKVLNKLEEVAKPVVIEQLRSQIVMRQMYDGGNKTNQQKADELNAVLKISFKFNNIVTNEKNEGAKAVSCSAGMKTTVPGNEFEGTINYTAQIGSDGLVVNVIQ